MLGEVARKPSVETPGALLFAEQSIFQIGSCMTEKNSLYENAAQAVKRSTETFRRLSEVLNTKIAALSGRHVDADVDSNHLTKEIVAHQGAWKMLQDALAKLREHDLEKEGVGKHGIDFDEARSEVLSRIARYVARQPG